jgi:transcriptional regulator with XRE-family HTH domain
LVSIANNSHKHIRALKYKPKRKSVYHTKGKIIFIYLTNSDKSMPKQSSLLGTALRQQRESKNLLLRQVAAAIEVDTAFISKVERGEKRASKEQLRKLATVLDLTEPFLSKLWLADKLMETIKGEDQAGEALKLVAKQLKQTI